VSDVGVKEVAKLQDLRFQSLFTDTCSRVRDNQPHTSPVTDAGVKDLGNLTNLESLHFNNTKVSAPAVSALQRIAKLRHLGTQKVTNVRED
jgi:hypothetical protein